MNFYSELESPLGTLLACASERGLRSLVFVQGTSSMPMTHSRRDDDMPLLRETQSQLEQYFAGTRKAFAIPLDLQGTSFQQAVWRALLALPFGATTSYRAIAFALGNASALRATGSAIGRNPVAIIVPCHRVLGSAGGLPCARRKRSVHDGKMKPCPPGLPVRAGLKR